MSTEKGPYRAYQSAVDPNLWLVRHGTVGQVYEYPTPITAGNACDALNTAYAAGQEDRSLAPPPAKELSEDMIRRHFNAYYTKVRSLCDENTAINMAQGYQKALKDIAKNQHGYLSPAPPPSGAVVEEGEKCQQCGNKYATVYWLNDDALWSRLSGKENGAGLLCPMCCDTLARDAGFELRWDAALASSP